MIRNFFGPLCFGILGYISVIGINGNNGAIQLVSLVPMCVIFALAIYVVTQQIFHIVSLYFVAFAVGTLLSVFASRAFGG